MSKDDPSIDDLSEQIQQLSTDERGDLFDALREDQLQSYLDARGEYVDQLREEGLVPSFPEDSPWANYCEERPYDPLCAGTRADAHRDTGAATEARRDDASWLDGVTTGGCAEIWEYLSAYRNSRRERR